MRAGRTTRRRSRPREVVAAPDRPPTSDRGRRPDRRRRAGRARLRDPARAAARGRAGAGGAARRGAGRGAREGQAARLAPALGRGRQPALAAPALRRAASASTTCRSTARSTHESVYFLTPQRALRIPTPPTMQNHGNYVASLSQLGRWLAERGRGGRRDDPARDVGDEAARRATGASSACAPATRAAAGTARSSPNFEPGSDILARVTVLAEGTQGHLTGAALDRFGLAGREPAGLGARREGGLEGREAARPRDPHDGLAAARRREVPRVRRLVHLPDGRRHGHARDGRRARLPRRRALRARPAAGAEDAPAACASILDGRRAGRVGGEDDPRGRLPRRCRSGCTRPGCCSAATAPGSSTCRR